MLTVPRLNLFDNNCFRLKMDFLKDSGREYIALNGKVIPPKVQSDHFCNCPRKCRKQFSTETWLEIFNQFYNIGNQLYQNQYLQNHIEIKAVHMPKGSPNSPAKRRVTCKYQVPILKEGETIDMFVDEKAVDTIDVCQKAFMNIYGLSEKRIRKQREKCIEDIIPDYYMKKSGIDYTKFYKENDEESKSSIYNENDDQPLDLSNHSERSFQVKNLNLDEFAEMLGVPKKSVNQEMIEKYEKMVEDNIKKQKKRIRKKQKNPTQIKSINDTTEHETKEFIDHTTFPEHLSNYAKLTEFADKLGIPMETVHKDIYKYEKMLEQRKIDLQNKAGLGEMTELSMIPALVSNDLVGTLQNKHLKLDEYGSSKNPEMEERYEKMLETSLTNGTNQNRRKQKTPNKTLAGLAERLTGLTELSMIPAQILNNGNITITPIAKKAEDQTEPDVPCEVSTQQNDEIMQVDSFFQNQLWQPELFDSSNSNPNSP